MMPTAPIAASAGPHYHKWEPEWMTLTQRSRFRISRLRPRGTAQLTTRNTDSVAEHAATRNGMTCYRAEMPRLILYLMKCFGDSDMHDAADAAQNAFIELLTKWDTVRSPRAWLRTVAFRQMLRQNASAGYPLEMLRQEPATAPASARLEVREETQAVLGWLRRLPLAQRQVLALIYDDFSYSEIAQITGTSEAAVRKNAERAKRTMKQLLEITTYGDATWNAGA